MGKINSLTNEERCFSKFKTAYSFKITYVVNQHEYLQNILNISEHRFIVYLGKRAC